MGIADHRKGSVLRPMLVLGRTSGYRIGVRCRSTWKALERCNEARRSSGRAERYACVATTQRFAVSIPGFELGLKSIARIQIGLPRRAEDRPIARPTGTSVK